MIFTYTYLTFTYTYLQSKYLYILKIIKKFYGATCYHLVAPCISIWWRHMSASGYATSAF